MRISDWSSDVCSSDLTMELEGTPEELDSMIHTASLQLMQENDPYLVAVYHFRNETAESGYTLTKKAIDFCLVHADRRQLPWTYALWGDMLWREGKYEDAIVQLRRALTLAQTSAGPMQRWGAALTHQGREDRQRVVW